MRLEDFEKYNRYYRSCKKYGVNQIFNNYLGIETHKTVPLSISHGIDFGHCYHPMDIYSNEPIHWAYNESILAEAIKIKPTLLIPHPWAILASQVPASKGSGTLLIGPPPGKSNDLALFEKIRKDIKQDWSILVKQNDRGSIKFWKAQGLTPVTAGNPNQVSFYHNLLKIMNQYSTIVTCTFSSALIFAASIGKEVVFIDNFTYTNYDTANYLKIVNFNSSQAKNIVNQFYHGNSESVEVLAKKILGFELLNNEEKLKENYYRMLEKITFPIYSPSESKDNAYLYKAKKFISLLLSRPGIVNLDSVQVENKIRQIIGLNPRLDNPQIIIKTVDELSVWLEGLNDNNFVSYSVPYREGITVSGRSIDPH